MKKHDWNNIEEATEFRGLPAGGYVCGITTAEDYADKEYIKCEFDIAEGEFKNYYKDLYASKAFWGGSFIKSYKEKALPFFKMFFTKVEKSNKGFKWADDETKLRGKLIGLVLSEEEYQKNDGTIGTRLYVSDFKTVEEIRKGDFKVKDKKTLSGTSTATSVINDKNIDIIDDDEPLPWE